MHYRKSQTPTKEVVSVIIINDNRVLMHLRDNKKTIAFPNFWSLPSGGLEKNETPLDAAKREVEEETNYKLSSPIPFFPHHIFINRPDVKTTHFFIEKYDNAQKINCNEGQKMEFMSAKKIGEINNVVPRIYPIVKEALDG